MSFKQILLVTASLAVMLPCAAVAQTAAATTPAATTPPAAAAAATKAAPATATASATKASTADASPVTHAEFEELLRQTLVSHPDIVMESVKKLHEMHVEETNRQMKEGLAKHKADIANDTTSPRIGNLTDPDATIYEFFDYHCGYCKHMLPTITKLVESDKKLRIILLEFPILAEDSVMAARASIAVYNLDKEKYFAFHSSLLKSNGKFDEKALSEAVKKVGLDWKKVKKEMDSPAVTDRLDKNREMADDIGVRGTPAFIIGDEVMPGAVPYEDLVKLIDAVRKGETVHDVLTGKASAESPAAQAPSGANAKSDATKPAAP